MECATYIEEREIEGPVEEKNPKSEKHISWLGECSPFDQGTRLAWRQSRT